MGLGNIGPTELIFLAIFLLLIFGAKRLPELGSGLGKGIREFKKSMRDINTDLERDDPPQQLNTTTTRAAVPPVTEKKEPSDIA